MKKRGLIVCMAGLVMILISFGIAQSLLPTGNPTMSSELLVPTLLEGMFDQITEEVVIFPAELHVFSFSTTTSGVPLLWGSQITDFQNGDRLSIMVSDSIGENYGIFQQGGPITFELFMISDNEIYNFEIQNNGDRPVSVIMMSSEDPDNSPSMTDPNSALMNTIFPLAISGIMIMLGLVLVTIGITLFIYDWRKVSNRTRNF